MKRTTLAGMVAVAGIAALTASAVAGCDKAFADEPVTITQVRGVATNADSITPYGDNPTLCLGVRNGTKVNIYCANGGKGEDKFYTGSLVRIKTKYNAVKAEEVKLDVDAKRGLFFKVTYPDGNYHSTKWH